MDPVIVGIAGSRDERLQDRVKIFSATATDSSQVPRPRII